ncbi:PREDICTED: DNA-directed RNA polymerases I and III subunit RPAC2 [Aptenodytes forsteri]|uniref:DNA-directed RNA polymerases I and III subunit RPAC2 n=1 Tax=Aptenodytes forsteri TaxID=9233 RepID=UPI0004F3FF54|nr:PREDICTED: DNA-directed RNA polymerases I and III subunit RPAC2 [Aptenodytes forsteri]
MKHKELTQDHRVLRAPICLSVSGKLGELSTRTAIREKQVGSVQPDGTDGNCVTFVLHDEDHTLGNSLRYMVMKNPDVEFCGYCITHPSESKINFRIQTRGALPAVEPFRKGLNDLMGVCQHVLNTFERSMKEYRAQREEEMQ